CVYRRGERGEADPSVEFVDRSKQRFAGNHIDVNAGLLVIPELILERPLGATLAHHGIFLSLQPLFQDGVAGNRTVRIESCGLPFLFLREKEEVEPTCDEHDCYADTDVRADGRFFLGSDSAATHQIAIESETGHVRQDGTGVFCSLLLVATFLWAFALLKLAIFDGAPAAAGRLCAGYGASRVVRAAKQTPGQLSKQVAKLQGGRPS